MYYSSAIFIAFSEGQLDINNIYWRETVCARCPGQPGAVPQARSCRETLRAAQPPCSEAHAGRLLDDRHCGQVRLALRVAPLEENPAVKVRQLKPRLRDHLLVQWNHQ